MNRVPIAWAIGWLIPLLILPAFTTHPASGVDLDYRSYLPLIRRARQPSPPSALQYGANIAAIDHANYIRDMGFGWMKGFVSWRVTEPNPGQFNWGDFENNITFARNNNLKLLLRVDRAPDWARDCCSETAPPREDRLDDWARFLTEMARRGRGRVHAYEIWNEPNLHYEWGNRRPDPARFTRLLQRAYPAIKAGDPNAIVVSGGLATTGNDRNDDVARSDTQYIQAMYGAGVRGFFDVLGVHPYGFAYAPEQDPGLVNGLAFRRAEEQRTIMLANGDTRPMWATEFGWVLDPAQYGSTCTLGEHQWMRQPEATQADYLVRAYQYARTHWPWMQAMFIFNLDFATDYWQGGCQSGGNAYCNLPRWYSILYRDNPCDPARNPIKERAAYGALRAMPK